MKRSLTFAVALAAGSLLVAAGPASAARTRTAPTAVTVVMHDPGCHWFSVAGKLTTTQTVAGSAKLTNYDEAALIVKSSHGKQVVKLGKTVLLGKGLYKITMVGQASDDNHLKLVVS